MIKEWFVKIRSLSRKYHAFWIAGLIGALFNAVLQLIQFIQSGNFFLLGGVYFFVFTFAMQFIGFFLRKRSKLQIDLFYAIASSIAYISVPAILVYVISYKEYGAWLLNWFVYAYAFYGTVKMVTSIVGLKRAIRVDDTYRINRKLTGLVSAFYTLFMMGFMIIYSQDGSLENSPMRNMMIALNVVIVFLAFSVTVTFYVRTAQDYKAQKKASKLPKNPYFDDKYDVVIIGAALAGLAAALKLAKTGKRILILEQHNMPGGVATSYCRGGVEFEASLHEMMWVGEKDHPNVIRKFFEEVGVDVDWVRIPEAFRYVADDIDAVIHSGQDGDATIPSRDIARACGEEEEDGPIYRKVLEFFAFCRKVDISCFDVQNNNRSIAYIATHHPELVQTAGYSSLEVMKAFGLPQKAIDVLSAYWIYLGTPASNLPFTPYAVVLSQYFCFGSYIPRHTSFEMSLKMAERVRELGVQIEYGQRVDKILVDKRRGAYGVRLASGDEIQARYILCGAYPNSVYRHMLDENVKVPKKYLKSARAKEMSVSAFSVVLLLDKSPEELNIKDYATFLYVGEGRDDRAYELGMTEGPYPYIACVCPNLVAPESSPKGTCVYSMTYLPHPKGFFGVNEGNYAEICRKNASFFIEQASKMLGVDLSKHVQEITIESPVSIAHYTGAFQGGIYGYSHSMDAHVVARIMAKKHERSFFGLYFLGAHHLNGDGVAPVINSGIHVARDVLLDMEKYEQ